jgi:hypothetical protein
VLKACLLSVKFRHHAAQRIGSPAADYSKTRLRKITFSAKWPPQTHAEGGQVEPVLARTIFHALSFGFLKIRR